MHRMSRTIWPGLLVWGAAWAALLLLDGPLELPNLALLLVLGATVASLWLPTVPALAAAALSVLAFNWLFVPPRGSLHVDLHQHTWLLVTTLGVACVVAVLVGRQRALARQARRHADEADALRALGDTLRDATGPQHTAPALQAALQPLCDGAVAVLLLHDTLPPGDDDAAATLAGPADAEQRAGLWLCLRRRQAFGPETGRHEHLRAWVLPLRGRDAAWGAAWLPLSDAAQQAPDGRQRAHAQALCDIAGLALERASTLRQAELAEQQAQMQALRSTLLAAISHDYRTPLATILGAASALRAQADRLAPAQQLRLADAIADEAERLSRMTDNTLQLVRLDGQPQPLQGLQRDWESAEELVGSVLRRLRQRDPGRRARARVEPGLPLLHCDAVLLLQLLDNLVDNALKHTQGPVEILARRVGGQLLLAVRDRGPGVPVAARERIFALFERGDAAAAAPGTGVGLAVCRAIALAHGGSLRLRARGHGGSSFELLLPLPPAPPPEGAR